MSSQRAARPGGGEEKVLDSLCELVTSITGVQLGGRQRVMVCNRLKKRMIELGISELTEYHDYFVNNQGQEIGPLISLLTTHHTFFFREFGHFEFLERSLLDELVRKARARGDKKIRIWSAAASRGQEAYSLALFLDYHLSRKAPDIGFEIYGTDICEESIEIAKNGVYHRNQTKEIPLIYLADHWAKGTGDIAEFAKLKPAVKSKCRFETKNLIRLSDEKVTQKFDLIFCKNVFIYFNQEQIKSITRELLKRLDSDGQLFLGYSETLNGLDLPIQSVGPSVYGHAGRTLSKTEAPKATPSTSKTAKAPVVSAPAIIRVLCVDDSPSIQALMKKVFSKENGFEIVATATNGLQAAEALKAHQIDVVTLDIHMPEQDGIEYLKKNYDSQHPPVVMVSSVSRESSNLAVESLKLGASDFVEKPTLNNLLEKGDEIRTKVRCALMAKADRASVRPKLDQAFARKVQITDPAQKARIIVASLAHRAHLKAQLSEWVKDGVPTYVLIEGLSQIPPETVGVFDLPKSVVIQDFKTIHDLKVKIKTLPVSMMILGEISVFAEKSLQGFKTAQILFEDIQKKRNTHLFADYEVDIVPATSFEYMSTEFLGKKK